MKGRAERVSRVAYLMGLGYRDEIRCVYGRRLIDASSRSYWQTLCRK